MKSPKFEIIAVVTLLALLGLAKIFIPSTTKPGEFNPYAKMKTLPIRTLFLSCSDFHTVRTATYAVRRGQARDVDRYHGSFGFRAANALRPAGAMRPAFVSRSTC